MTPTKTDRPFATVGERATDPSPVEGDEARTQWQERFPPRTVANSWPSTRRSRAQVDQLVATMAPHLTSDRVQQTRCRGLPLLLDWLEAQPGQTWQQRWLASGADTAGDDWAQVPQQWLTQQKIDSPARLRLLTSTFLVVVGADLIRPSLRWLLTGGKKRKLVRNMIQSRDQQGFERLQQRCQADAAVTPSAAGDVLFRSAVIVAAKGGRLGDITTGDVLEILEIEHKIRRRVPAGPATIRMLRDAGVLPADVPSFRELRSQGQRSIEQLVDRYPVVSRPMRGVFIDYLRERQPAVDYSTLAGLSYSLVRCFWTDLERHHPGIDSLNLSRDVAGAWKRRLRTKTRQVVRDGRKVEVETERIAALDILATVRAFYLDLAEWALEDPGRWGTWVAPCPISQTDLVRRKQLRHRKARMDSRTRERLPVLPVLVETTNRWRRDAKSLLDAGLKTPAGERFTAAGMTLTRIHRPHGDPGNVWVNDSESRKPWLLNQDEEHSFWAWAIIEVLRHTGMFSGGRPWGRSLLRVFVLLRG